MGRRTPGVLAWSVLINTIINMVLVSIQPFAFRKICLLVVALLGLSSVFCLADPVFMCHSTSLRRTVETTQQTDQDLANAPAKPVSPWFRPAGQTTIEFSSWFSLVPSGGAATPTLDAAWLPASQPTTAE